MKAFPILFPLMFAFGCGAAHGPDCGSTVNPATGTSSLVHVAQLGGELRASTLEQITHAGVTTFNLYVWRADTGTTVNEQDLDPADSTKFENGEKFTLLGISNTPPGWTFDVDGVTDNWTNLTASWGCETP